MMLVRTRDDGTLWIPRPDAQTEGELDALRFRLLDDDGPRWAAVLRADVVSVQPDPERLIGKRVAVVGKGPSLSRWLRERAAYDVVVCVNESGMLVSDAAYVVAIDARVVAGITFDLVVGKPALPQHACVIVPPERIGDALARFGHTRTQCYDWQTVPLCCRCWRAAPLALTCVGLWGGARAACVDMVGFDGKDVDHSRPEHGGVAVYAPEIQRLDISRRAHAAFPITNAAIDAVVRHFRLRTRYYHRDGWV
jgi:hypothetical protein